MKAARKGAKRLASKAAPEPAVGQASAQALTTEPVITPHGSPERCEALADAFLELETRLYDLKGAAAVLEIVQEDAFTPQRSQIKRIKTALPECENYNIFVWTDDQQLALHSTIGRMITLSHQLSEHWESRFDAAKRRA